MGGHGGTRYGMNERHDRLTTVLHWLLAALVLGLAPLGVLLARTAFPSAAYDRLHVWHRSLGELALIVALALAAWRARRPRGAPPAGSSVRHRLARTTHRMMLALLIVVAVSKIARGAWGLGWRFFGLTLDAPWPPNPKVSGWLSAIHDYTAFGVMALIALHIAAAVQRRVGKGESLAGRLR